MTEDEALVWWATMYGTGPVNFFDVRESEAFHVLYYDMMSGEEYIRPYIGPRTKVHMYYLSSLGLHRLEELGHDAG
jgi:hypothetical protein